MLRSAPRAFLLFLVVLSGNIHGYYSIKDKRSVLGDGLSKLVKVEPVEARSLADLTNGVYALGISGGRSAVCGSGSGGTVYCVFVVFSSTE